MRLLFHGTSHVIKDLSHVHLGKGGDHNSALGFHTSDSPYVAFEYAEISSGRNPSNNPGKIIVIGAINARSYVEDSYYEFFGIDETGNSFKSHEDFSAWRKDLVNEGFDLMEMDGHEDEIVVILEPSSDVFKIVAELSQDEAVSLHDRYEEEGLGYNDIDRRMSLLKEVIPERQVEPSFAEISP